MPVVTTARKRNRHPRSENENSVQWGRSQSAAVSAVVDFLGFQGMVPPSIDWKEQRPTIGTERARRVDTIPVGNAPMIVLVMPVSTGRLASKISAARCLG